MGALADSIEESARETIARQQDIISRLENRIATLESQRDHDRDVMNAMILLVRAAVGNA